MRLEHQLGQPLVQRHRQRVGIRARVGIAQLLKERGIERLTCASSSSFGHVEDQIRAEGFQSCRQVRCRSRHLDLGHLMAALGQRFGDGFHRLWRIELGFLFGISQTQVMSEGDFHSGYLMTS